MDWKKIGKALLFPHIAILILLPVPVFGLMIWAMIVLGNDHPLTIASYVLAFYTLTVWSVRIPQIIRFFKTFKAENKYTNLWFNDHRLRTNVTLSGNILWNGAYGALQLGLGIYHHNYWFYSLAAYYACLVIMRFFLVRHTLRHEPGKDQRQELRYYRTCGWVFLLLNLALSGIMLYMIRENRITQHNEITTIAMAAYTFTTMTMAIVNIFRYRKYHSPVLSAARAASLTAACVSMLSLENTMLVTFNSGEMTIQTRQVFLSISGGAVALFILAMAVYMIVNANRKLRIWENENGK